MAPRAPHAQRGVQRAGDRGPAVFGRFEVEGYGDLLKDTDFDCHLFIVVLLEV